MHGCCRSVTEFSLASYALSTRSHFGGDESFLRYDPRPVRVQKFNNDGKAWIGEIREESPLFSHARFSIRVILTRAKGHF